MRWLVVAASLALAGCASSLQSGNAAGGIVKERLGPNKGGDALNLADAHCRKYGKAARISGQNVFDNTLTFDCVTP